MGVPIFLGLQKVNTPVNCAMLYIDEGRCDRYMINYNTEAKKDGEDRPVIQNYRIIVDANSYASLMSTYFYDYVLN
jgi:hypothetical protein